MLFVLQKMVGDLNFPLQGEWRGAGWFLTTKGPAWI